MSAYWDAYNSAYNAGEARNNAFQQGQQRRAAIGAGAALASGDYSGAAKALYGAGNLDAGLQVQNAGRDREVADRKEKAAWMLQAAQALKRIPVANRTQEYQTHIAPVLKTMGAPEEALSQVSDLSDAGLDGFIYALGGTPDMSAHKGDWKEVKNADGSSHFDFFPADPYLAQSQGNAPAPDAPVSPPAAPAQSGGDAYLNRLGQVESNNDPNAQNGSSTGLYQFHPDTFARLGGTDIHDPAQQKAAALKLAQESAQTLQQAGVPVDDANLYIMHQQGAGGGLALLKADPNANAVAALTPVYGNPTRARQAIVNNGGSADMTAGQFVDMWRQKWGPGAQQPPQPPAQPYQVASAGGTPPSPSQGPQAAPMASGGMFSRPGSAARPKDAPSGYRYKADGTSLEAIPGGPADVGGDATPGDPQLTGDAYLQSLPASQRPMVKALAEGRMTFPSGMALSKPYWQQMLQAVGQYDPQFDTANPTSRAKTRADFTSGKSAQNVTALNTVVGHLDHLDRAINGLGNTGGFPGSQWNNKAAHFIADASGTNARYKDFETAKTAVANELTRVFRGTGGAEADIQGWMKQLDSADSPEALHTVVRSMATLIESRLQALGEQYNQGLGLSKDPIALLTPDKQKAFNRMMGVPGAGVSTDAPKSPQTSGVIRYDAQGRRIK